MYTTPHTHTHAHTHTSHITHHTNLTTNARFFFISLNLKIYYIQMNLNCSIVIPKYRRYHMNTMHHFLSEILSSTCRVSQRAIGCMSHLFFNRWGDIIFWTSISVSVPRHSDECGREMIVSVCVCVCVCACVCVCGVVYINWPKVWFSLFYK